MREYSNFIFFLYSNYKFHIIYFIKPNNYYYNKYIKTFNKKQKLYLIKIFFHKGFIFWINLLFKSKIVF